VKRIEKCVLLALIERPAEARLSVAECCAVGELRHD
jgi:hypothetical protein